jgi:hypothetical protein
MGRRFCAERQNVEWQNVKQQNAEWQNVERQKVKQQNVKWQKVKRQNVKWQNVKQQNVEWQKVEKYRYCRLYLTPTRQPSAGVKYPPQVLGDSQVALHSLDLVS